MNKGNEEVDPEKGTGSQYDRIFKENMDGALPFLMERLFKLELGTWENLPTALAKTKERRMDSINRITTPDGQKIILHVEYQTYDEKDMVVRMLEYYVMLKRKYVEPITQVVLYSGEISPAKMTSALTDKNCQFKYTILHFRKSHYQEFLRAKVPEAILLGILGDFGKVDAEKVVKEIVESLQQASPTALGFEKYIQQLRILLNLRNFNKEKKRKIMNSILASMDIKTDTLYLRGIEEGKREGELNGEIKWKLEEKEETSKKMFLNGLAIDLIHKATGLPMKRLQEIQKEVLQKK
jgi:predicted transposase YdaD